MICPECSAIHGYDIEMRFIMYGRQYETTSTDIQSSNQYIKMYQCPCCKAVYTENVNVEQEVWAKRYEELLQEYNLNGGNTNDDETGNGESQNQSEQNA